MVVNMLASDGRDDTPLFQRVFWTGFIGVISAVLLVAGGLPSLQTAAIASALPFSLALLVAIWGFAQALRTDVAKRDAMSVQTVADASIPWQERLGNLFQYPTLKGVEVFQQYTVRPVMELFTSELQLKGVNADTVSDTMTHAVSLIAYHGDEIDFIYSVYASELALPDDAMIGDTSALPGKNTYWRAEVHLTEGGQDYDVMGWTSEQITNDILDQYERHLNYLNSLR